MVVALVVVAVVVVGGGAVLLTRGGDERSEEEQAYVDALAAYSDSQDAEGVTFDAEESRCFAEALVDAVGVDRLRELATPEEIRPAGDEDEGPLDDLEVDRSQAEAIYDDSDGCVDYRRMFLDIPRESGASDAQLDCLDSDVTDDEVRSYLVATFDEDLEAIEEHEAAFEATVAACEDAG